MCYPHLYKFAKESESNIIFCSEIIQEIYIFYPQIFLIIIEIYILIQARMHTTENAYHDLS